MLGRYWVFFTNPTGCAIGISDISWSVTVAADSEAEALELGLKDALALNREFGMPPHGLKVSEAELRRLATVRPQREM